MNRKRLKNEKGSITLYVLISMFFFIVIVFGIYFNTNNKMQKQNKEIDKIQQEYEKEKINEIYEERYDNYVNAETPTIQGYVGAVLKGEVIGEKTSSKKTVYFASDEVKLKLLSKNENNTFAYSTTQDGDKIQMDGNTLDITATIEGTTYYFYVVDSSGNYSKYYTAITAKLVTMQNKTIYVGEGQTVDIGKIEGENLGSISYSETEDNTIATVLEDKVTGVKAGNTTLTVTETNAGQTCTLTIKVVKIGLAKTEETTLLGVDKTVAITGTNYGTLSTQVEDSTIATANISGNNLTVVPKKEGNTTITVTENNARVTETYKIKVASVALSPESGIYTMPTEGKATIKTQVTAVNAEKIEYAWSDDIEDWKEIENNEIATKTNATAGTYYLLVRINGEATYKSKGFVVGANTEQANKITITIDKEGWTNEDVTATITYPDVTTSSTRKAGYGTTLVNAQTASSSATAPTTSVTVSENGYVYAEATDAAGNKVTASLQVTNIDKTAPSLSISTTTTTRSITVTATAQDSLSGISGYRFSKDNGNTWTAYQTSSTYTFDDLYGNVAGTSHNITVQVKDKIENTNTVSKIVSTSKNTTYYTQTANDLLCTIGGRNWYKSNDTDAIAGVLYRKGTDGDWTCPILVSTSIEGVKYYTTHDYSVQTDDIGTVVYGGVTYYYSSSGQSMPDASYTSKYKMLNSTSTRYTSMEQAAQELLRLYYNNTYPSLSISSTNSTTKSITVVANAQQNGREIVGYRFSKDNGFTWTSYQTSGTYTFNSLYGNLGGTSYNIKVQVKDSIGDTNTVTNTVSTSKNTTYYTQTADDLLCTIGGRGFYKYDSTGAIAGIAYMKTDSGNWTCPILVSTSIEGVKYYTTYDYSIMTEGISTVSYGGVTYYYSSDGQWVHNEEYTSKYKMLNTASSRYSSVAQAAQVLLELYYGD